jgi:serine/threonine protein phosphatase PrpC
MLEIEFAQLSDPGRIRDHNEDFLGHAAPANEEQARTHGWLFALADGVGGHDRGEVASRVAVECVLEGFRKAPRRESLNSLLPRLVQSANTKVFETGMAATPSGSNMATTMVACALRYDHAIVSHAGDSRCYLVRQGYAAAITRDHTFTNEQLRMGAVTAGEAVRSQVSHVLSRSLGNNMFLSVDTSENQILAGDVLLLCSDGLHNSVSSEDIGKIAGHGAPLEHSAQELIDLAKQRDGSDNISVQLIRVRSVERVGMYRGRHYKLH